MRIGYFYSFTTKNLFGPFVRWDSPDDNGDLVDYASSFGVTASVDDTVSPPVFNWEDLSAPGDTSGSIELTEGIFLRVGAPVGGAETAVIPTGSWFSDPFGRPFNLDDLMSGA